MAAIEEARTVRVSVKLNNGSTETGQVKTVSVSIGSLNVSRYNSNSGNDKALAVATALALVFANSVYSLEKTNVSILSEE